MNNFLLSSRSFFPEGPVNNFFITFGRVTNDPSYVHGRFGSRVVDVNFKLVRFRFAPIC